MRIGLCTIDIEVLDSFSLKEKRSVVLSLLAKIRASYNVSVAEVGKLNSLRYAQLAIVSVNTEGSHLNSTLASVVTFIESDLRVKVINFNTELI
ncbi:MAG: DUF503 domain-containing protein [Caldisericaceae bacterium]